MGYRRAKEYLSEHYPWILAGCIITLAIHFIIYLSTDHAQKYIFVHIPKTGGTTLNQWIDQQHTSGLCKQIRSAHTHYLDGNTARRMGYQPITIIREPSERFVSSFYYWRHGSKDIAQWQRPLSWRNGQNIDDPNQFIKILSDEQHPQHKNIIKVISQRDQFTHRHHFLPQNLWLNAKDQKTIIICYDKKNLNNRIQTQFDANNINCPIHEMPNINQTLKPKQWNLSEESIRWLKKTYSHDFELWHRHCEK
tara:strand:- start:208 stop:960 length:753 start_codon:yes stop_codon:yes gene_type:complete